MFEVSERLTNEQVERLYPLKSIREEEGESIQFLIMLAISNIVLSAIVCLSLEQSSRISKANLVTRVVFKRCHKKFLIHVDQRN